MDPIKENWELIKENMKEEYEISSIAYNIWISPLMYGGSKNSLITIYVPKDKSQTLEYISKKYTNCFQSCLFELFGENYNIEFVLEPMDMVIDNEDNNQSVSIPKKTDMARLSELLKQSNLNPKYRFESFVDGSNSTMAFSACQAVANSPGQDFNPLYIYGGSGLGKTHLLNSIGHYIINNNPNLKVLYVTSEDFTNEVIESIRLGKSSGNSNAITKLREKYRNIDVLLIDDIQFIIGKQATQEEFFYTFNALHNAGKAIVISSDKHPKEMTALEERYTSRFEWGLTVDIQPPNYETRVAILQKYAETLHKSVPNEVIEYIADNIRSNVRELEGAFNKVNAFSKINQNMPITLELAKEALKDMINPDKPKIVTPNTILDVVAEHFKINSEDIVSKKRSAEFTTPRHIFMYLCRTMTDTSFKGIAALLERDHSTVMHGVDKITKEYENNSEMKETIDILKKKIVSS